MPGSRKPHLHRRRGAALVSAVAILLIVAAFAGLFLSTHSTHVATAEAQINRLRAQAAALGATQLVLWNLSHDSSQQANVARVVYEHDTSYSAKPLFQTDGTFSGTAFHVDLWPGEDAVRACATGNAGGAYSTVWAQLPLTVAADGPLSFPAGFTSIGLRLNNGACISGTRLQLTSKTGDTKRSAYWNQKLNVSTFQTHFKFRITNGPGEGFTFVIQNQGLTAVGAKGPGLGYQGIGSSVALKFDLSGGGQGNTIGVYTNGAAPTTPCSAIGGGVSLSSESLLDADLRYNGTMLELTLTDGWNSYSQKFSVNIPAVVGDTKAYVGFTASTGAHSSTQEIYTWTYSGP
jgi:hypothetical protein